MSPKKKTSPKSSTELTSTKPIEQLFNNVVGLPTGEVSLPDGADKVNNVVQKERAAYEAGVTRRRYLLAIKDLLEAVEEKDGGTDQYGAPVKVMVPNVMARAKGAELAGKFFGDYKEHASVGNVTHNKIVVQWLSAPVIANRV